MLELTRHPMKIAHLNLRTELHGDDEVKCVDIKLTFEIANIALDGLAPGLRLTFYEAGANDADLLDDTDHATHVKYPQLGTLKWGGDYEHVGVHMHTGNGKAKGDLIFPEAAFNKISVKPLEGGSCACTARAQVELSAAEAAKLFDLLHHEVRVSLDMSQATGGEVESEEETEREEEAEEE